MARKVDKWKSLNALLGSYGVKTSLLETIDDYWVCAQALWPDIKREPGETLIDLQKRIKSISARDRKATAKFNIVNVPDQFLSIAPKHQRVFERALEKRMAAA